MKMFKLLTIALSFSLSSIASAKIIQIIHTNDLHSYFEGTRGGKGGYAQLKVVIDRLKNEAKAKGIPTLYLDAGDFGEGSSFYFSNKGADSIRALDILGVDVTVLGNHDFILGAGDFRRQIAAANPKATILSANLKGKRWLGLSRLKDYVDHNIDDLKIRVFGLTTNEIHYMYPLRPLGYIANPHKIGVKMAEKAKHDNVDFTIALTHIGLDRDILLVQKTRSIDLVVGGHDHTTLTRPQLTKNLDGKLIPILQAGSHSAHVGSMIFSLEKGSPPQMIDYKLYDVTPDMPQDEHMRSFVESAHRLREEYFGRSWKEVIGNTEIPLTGDIDGYGGQQGSCWSQHIARLTRQLGKTELGIQFDVFQGEQISPGPVTFGDMIDNFPHFTRWHDQGWKVSRSLVSGFLIKKILGFMANSELALQVTIDGIQARGKNGRGLTRYNPRIHSPDEALINGSELSGLRYYTVALPSEVTFGSLKMLNIFGTILFHNLRNVQGSDLWPALEKYIQENSPLRCLDD